MDQTVTRRIFIAEMTVVSAGLWLGVKGAWAAPARTASAGPADPKLIEDLVAANRILADKGIVDARGHVSVRHNRDPNRYLIARAIAPALVTAADVMEMDLDNNPISNPKNLETYSERFIHSEIYKVRPDVQSVIHGHTPSILLFASSDIPLRPIASFSSFIGEKVPLFSASERGGGIGTTELGRAMAQVLGRGGAVLMRGHGVIVVGFSIPNAVGRIYHLDNNAQNLSRALAMGAKPTYIQPAKDGNDAGHDNNYDREWELWKYQLTLKMRQE